jgi:hypothetical protein
MERFLRPTPLLDHSHPAIRGLVEAHGFSALPLPARIGAIYAYVRDEVAFGYNEDDALPASRVLADGHGQCNTKTTLLMALLRAAGVPCRFHGATIHKSLQRGVVPPLVYALAPTDIVHSWAEVRVDDRWVALEGVILDDAYLDGLRARFPAVRGAFLGWAVGTDDLQRPQVEWRGEDTWVQRTGVNADLGVFDDPDTFYAAHGSNLSGVRRWLFRAVIRPWMNRRVRGVRACAAPRAALSVRLPADLCVRPDDVAR